MNKQSNHYKICKPEAIELIDRYHLNFIEGNIIKYILRSPFKGDRVGDLKKALYYANKLPKQLICQGKRADFDIDELDQYLDSHALYAIEADAVASVIQGNFYHTVTHDDSGKRILEYKENYISKLIEIAIEERNHNEKIEESISKHVKSLADPRPIFHFRGKYFNSIKDICKYGMEFPDLPLDVEQFKRDMQDRIREAEMNSQMNPEFTNRMMYRLLRASTDWAVGKAARSPNEIINGSNDSNDSKEFNPDWLPPHPLCTLLDLVDEDPEKFTENLLSIDHQNVQYGKELELILSLYDMIHGNYFFVSMLPKIVGGSKEFWKNRYDNYWEKRKK